MIYEDRDPGDETTYDSRIDSCGLEPEAPCRFCGAPAIGVFRLDGGCFCYPADQEQALCAQHILRASPLLSMDLIRAVDASMLAAIGWPTV